MTNNKKTEIVSNELDPVAAFNAYFALMDCSDLSDSDGNHEAADNVEEKHEDTMIMQNEENLQREKDLVKQGLESGQINGKVQKVKLNEIKENDQNPYEVNGKAPDFVALRKSIEENGLMEPVVVMWDCKEYVVLSGSRRIAACRELGWETIDAWVLVDISNDEAIRILLDSNLHRQDITEHEIIKILKLELQIMKVKDDVAKKILSNKYGKSERQIRRYIRIIRSLDDSFIDLVGTKMTLGAAYTITQLKIEGDEKMKLFELISKNDVVVNKNNINEMAEGDFVKEIPKTVNSGKHTVTFNYDDITKICGKENITNKELKGIIMDIVAKYSTEINE